ncbi:MAG: DUF3794 domain-containing protein [Oscillospiraceae bacterium]|mgnify:CR=1 FL=1|jgi:hypothetical protein|nr:DUF3794 domain-containing protein [Oscillospiraceae bacterium]
MELKLTRESICINEIVFDGSMEQAVELDYLLPDYCPSIFKVLKSRIVPKITSERIMNGKLLVDGVAYIKILYVSEESYRICTLSQKQAFSKSLELKEGCEEGCVSAFVKCDYVNCRVINQRRLDIRGALTIRATVSTVRKLDILCGASGMGLQVNTCTVTALDRKLYASKEFTVKEELDLAYGKPSVTEVLDSTATASLTDYKLIANKVVVKGEILLHTLYTGSDDESGPEIMDFTVPISQIVDLPGVSEDYQCVITFDVTGIDLSMKQDGDGECTSFDGEFCIRVCCEADRNGETQLIGDAYSTGYELQPECSKVKIERLVCAVNESCVCKNSIAIPQGEIARVYDISCDFTNESCRWEDGAVLVNGNLEISILGLDNDGMPLLIEKSNPCEMKLEPRGADLQGDTENVLFSPSIRAASVSYSLTSGSEVEVRAEIRICGILYQYCFYDVVSAIHIDEGSRKERKDDVVLRLYFAERGERVWDIAKRFGTSVEAIVLENNLESETLPGKIMLLIPQID